MRRLGGSVAFALVMAAVALTSAGATSYVAAGDMRPTWSPDGRRIAFTATMRDGANWDRPAIYVVNADGGGLRRISDGDASDAAWSPDARFAFASTRNGQIPCSGGICGPIACCRHPTALHVMNADGSGARPVVTLAGYNTSPTWSPDGRRLAFTNSGDVWIADVETGAVANVTPGGGHDSAPAWAPDGKRIAFTRGAGQQPSVYVMNVDGTGIRQLIAHASEPAWSPDGRTIAFVRDARIYVASADGTDAKFLTRGRAPAWAPDSRKIAFEFWRSSGGEGMPGFGLIEIYVIDVSAAAVHRVTTVAVPGGTPPTVERSVRLLVAPRVARPRAGLTASLRFDPARHSALAASDVRCAAYVGGNPVQAAVRAARVGEASCTWKVPARPRAKVLTGWIAAAGERRMFSIRIR